MHVMLSPHPDSPPSPIERIEVKIERQGQRLWLRFAIWGDVDRVAWPETAVPGRADNLWKHTCCETFVRSQSGYREFNLSPSGQWASYRFESYREGMADAVETAQVQPLDGAWDMVALEALVDVPDRSEALALSAVIEDINGEKSYWALAHPSDKPDFHHPDSFTLDLP